MAAWQRKAAIKYHRRSGGENGISNIANGGGGMASKCVITKTKAASAKTISSHRWRQRLHERKAHENIGNNGGYQSSSM
jgi:hypothetical protein